MKNSYMFLILIIFLSISVLNAQDKADQNSPSKAKSPANNPARSLGPDTLYYQVFGMDCPGCHGALEKQIDKLSAVNFSRGDWVNQEVMVIVKKDSVLNEKELLEKIEKANFTPGEKVNK